MRPTSFVFTALTLAVIAGCATPPGSVPPSFGEAANSGSTQQVAPTFKLESANLAQYLLVQPEQVGLVNVADDGTFTFLAFRQPPSDVQVFDQDGKLLVSAVEGNLAGVQGVFKGLLVKRGNSNSFVTPNPRTKEQAKPRLDADPTVVALTRKLDAQTIAMPAFKRALELAGATGTVRTLPDNAAAPAREPRAATGSTGDDTLPKAPSVFTTTATPTSASARPTEARSDDLSYQMTADGPLLRVFFASGGRAVVSPDDGLSRLEAEAQRSRDIRIVGYTDGIGSTDGNAALAKLRAESIRLYLIRRGVPEESITVLAAPPGSFLTSNDTSQGRAANRRVEVLFVREVSKAAKPAPRDGADSAQRVPRPLASATSQAEAPVIYDVAPAGRRRR